MITGKSKRGDTVKISTRQGWPGADYHETRIINLFGLDGLSE